MIIEIQNVLSRPLLICDFCGVENNPDDNVYIVLTSEGLTTFCIPCCIDLQIHVKNIITQ